MIKSKKSGAFIVVVGLIIYLVGAHYLNDKEVAIFGWIVGIFGVIINFIILFKVLRKRK